MHHQMMWMTGYKDAAAGEFNTIQDPFTGRKLVPRPVDHFVGLNQHLAMVEHDKRSEMTTQQVVVTSRWNPTPEQLQTLEELYQRGTRTPSADQIQQITSQLRRYGKIEGKNVFYWFQNHKARERQKRRRHLESLSKKSQPPGTGSAFEVEPTKNSANSTTISMKTTQAGATKGADGWVQFDIAVAEEMLSQRRRNATWQMHKRPHDNFINVFDLGAYFNPHHHEEDEAQTLQLFPLESVQRAQEEGEEGATMSSSSGSNASDNVTTPYRFFEFLPLKN